MVGDAFIRLEIQKEKEERKTEQNNVYLCHGWNL